MKKRKLVLSILLFTLLVIVTGCNKSKDEVLTDAMKFKNEYESINGTVRKKDGKIIRSLNIPSDNPITYATAGDIIDSIKGSETFVVYFGFSDCPWCRSVIPTLIDVAKKNNLSEIYYVDVKEIRDVLSLDDNGNVVTTKKGTDDYYKLLTYFENVLSDYNLTNSSGEVVSTGEKRIFAPNIVSVVNGEAKELESGVSDKQTDPYMELTEEMLDEMNYKLKCAIKCVTESKNSCSLEHAC